MKSEAPLDYAAFQLSPRRSRCELFVSSHGKTEKLASGSVKPFVSHLKVAEEQVASAVQLIKLESEKRKNAEAWFTKGTLERFVRFVSTPEILELVNTCDAEMSQLEAARKIYSQEAGDQNSGGDGTGNAASADATKRELLRAVDVRLIAVRQDLSTACARASAAGFNPDTVPDLQLFADRFGAHRLNEACTKYISLSRRRPDLIVPWKPPGVDDGDVRSSGESDMSIDGPTENHTGSDTGPQNQPPQQDKTTTTQQQNYLDQPTKLFTPFPARQNNVNEKDKAAKVSEKEENKAEAASTESSSISAGQPARRLSVQDRINLFENKQKENNTSSGNSGGKPVVSRTVELRRLSSDGSSAPGVAEKSVLRRWSGASDMSIDLGGEKKDVESPLCTPSSVSCVSQTKLKDVVSGVAEDKDQKGLNVPSTSSSKIEPKSVSDQVEVQNQVVFDDQRDLKEKLEIFSGGEKRSGGFIKDHIGSETWLGDSSNRMEFGGFKNQVDRTQFAVLSNKTSAVKSDGRFTDRVGVSGVRDETVIHSNSKEQLLADQFKGVEDDLSAHQPQWRSFPGELVKMDKKDLPLMDKKAFEMDDSGVQKTKVQNPVSAGCEHVRKLQVRRDERSFVDDNTKMDFPGKKVLERQDSSSSISAVPVEQVQRVRQSKGNQELNNELKMKANELEKLFAAHKLRVPGDQSGSSRRSKPVAVDVSPEQFLIEEKNTAVEPTGSSSNMEEFNSPTPPTKMADNKSYGSVLRHNFSELSISDDSRGKFYQMYMQKRDAKLREEWVSKGAEKEAKMKSMQDSLEKSRAEMKAKFVNSLDRQDSISSAQRRAEKLRSFNYRSNMEREQTVDLIHSEEDEDLSQLLEQKPYGQERLYDDSYSGDAASRSTQTKKTLPNRNSSLSTSRTTPVSAPRSAVKVSNSSSLRRRGQTENPLAQSVPNFSDLRKENTKPSSGISKTTSRPQVRNNARSKSALRKSSATLAEFKDSSLLSSDDIVLAPMKFDKEQSEQSFGKYLKNVESKPFLRKGDGKGIGGAGSVRLKSSMACGTLRDEEEFDEPAIEAEDLMDLTNEDKDEGLEAMEIEDSNIDSEKARTSQGSDKSGISESENGESMRSLSQLDPSTVAELPVPMPSTFHTVGLIHDAPGESPVSWNSRIHHSFSYPHETSDIDASMDSPIGSPASWNSHNLTQTETDAARMRKKWGSAQKPTLIVNLSNQSRKDVTKGFKRLLKFGRKSRGSESLVDWISATTSEGDDDTEDGRDPANRSSEDLRKSRMGFSLGPFDDSFNESELFNERVQALESAIPAPPAKFKLREDQMSGSSLKAPRSFFSLSSFRSKGNDSKPR